MSKKFNISLAAVLRCNATVDFLEEKPLFPPTINNKEPQGHFLQVAGDMLGVIPGYFCLVMLNNSGKLPSMHSLYFQINQDVLPYGAALHASVALTHHQPKIWLAGRKHYVELLFESLLIPANLTVPINKF
ncbi:hypothetical protein RJ641_024061 [Dillenia turbinata]|uniref:Uncharacterized protein n=1 Tax=Dillenia turbinata TaxID=194707 RepID=A0AAN8UJW2_9MAGN